MNRSPVRPGRAGTLALALVATVALAGCDLLLSSEAGLADRVEVSLTGNSTVPLLLVTSLNFIAEYDVLAEEWRIALTQADTVRVTSLPFNHSREIRGRDRYLVRIINPSGAVTADVGMEVRLDGKLVYSERAFLANAFLQYFTWFSPMGGP